MINWESQSKTPPQSPEDGHISCILLIRIAFCHVSEKLPLHCLFYVTMNNYFCFLFYTACDVVTILLIFAKYLWPYLHIFTCTYRSTHTQAHMYNQHTRRMATTRHRSLVERGGRKALLKTLGKTRYSRISRKRFEHIELPAKLLDYFLQSNKSNINQ